VLKTSDTASGLTYTNTGFLGKRQAVEVLIGSFVGFLVFVVLLVLSGVVYQAIGSATDARRYLPPGRMVDVGGHRLHLCCAGEGSRTVVMDSGLPGSSLSWSLVQPEVAKFTRVCSYDRAGLGWSDVGPTPRTSRRIVEELHRLLKKAEIEGPYVLVGHSFGAPNMRLYASKYPDEVAGMVLVDPLHPREWLHITAEGERKLKQAVRLSRYGAFLARLGIARLVSSLARIGASALARFSVSLLTGGVLKGRENLLASVEKLLPDLRPVIRVFWTPSKSYEAMAGQIDGLPESAAQIAATGDFGDIPLVVLSASNPGPARMMEQDALAGLSSRGKHLLLQRGVTGFS